MTWPATGDGRPTPDQRRWLWTPPQRRTLAALTLLGCGLLAVGLLNRPAAVPDPPAGHPPRFNDLADRLDPNTATVDELGVLPGIGRSKAEAIVFYRDAAADRPVFRKASDLSRVNGIGPSIAAKIVPYLVFPEGPAAVAPDERPSVGRACVTSPGVPNPGSAPARP